MARLPTGGNASSSRGVAIQPTMSCTATSTARESIASPRSPASRPVEAARRRAQAAAPTNLSGGGAAGELGIIVEHRRKPALGFLKRPSLAQRVVRRLIALDLADAEVVAVGMGEIDAADAGARPHRIAFRQADAGGGLTIEQFKQR